MPKARVEGTLFEIDLVKYPDVFLRSKSHEVKFPLDDKTARLIKWMTKAMYQHHGIGLAAVQVGYLQRIFVLSCISNLAYGFHCLRIRFSSKIRFDHCLGVMFVPTILTFFIIYTQFTI